MSLKKFKQINYKKVTILFLIFLLGVVAGYLVLYPSYAYYEESKNFDVINGTVEAPRDIYFAYYIDGIISRNMPAQNIGYTLDTEKSNCNNGVIPTWDNAGWKFAGDYHNYNGVNNTKTKCTLYFNKTSKTVSNALDNIEVNTYPLDFTKSACDDESCESHEKGIYETKDYDGNPTYYYRGSVENNYVKFAGFYWRIIRINSNHANGEASEDRQYGTSKFNTSNNNNMYVGYMYTSGNVHGTGTPSTIKTDVDKFYVDKLTSGVGTGTVTTYNKGYLRVDEWTPILTCENSDAYYTVSNASNGNKKLSYPIGLITVDEAMLSGCVGGFFDGYYNHQNTNTTGYLITRAKFLTMTPTGGYNPYGFDYWTALVFYVQHTGKTDDEYVDVTYGIRPVINIRFDVTITGNGTMTDPYIIN